MPLVALVCASLLGWTADDLAPKSADVTAEYGRAQAAAGRSSADQVRLALWCEAHGLTAERLRHLTLAVLADPANATARGLAGLVARDGRWVRPEAVARGVEDDPDAAALRAEYQAQRSKTPYTADAQWTLGLWADEHGLPDQARAHFTAVTRLDPSRDVAWKRLGYKKQNGQWTTDAQIAAHQAETEAQKAAGQFWRPQFERWREMLTKASKRDEARDGLLGVTDPRAVGSIIRVFGTDRDGDLKVATTLLGQIESPDAARALATLAVFARSSDIRRVSLETLRQRDPRDFVDFWISLIRVQTQYWVQPVGGPGSPGVLAISGQKANTQRIYRPLNYPKVGNYPGSSINYDANGLPVITIDQGVYLDRGNPMAQTELDARRSNLTAGSDLLLQTLAPNNLNSSASQALKNLAINPSLSDKSIELWDKKLNGGAIIPGDYNRVIDTQIQIPIGEMIRESKVSAVVAQAQLARDVAILDAQNAAIRQHNDPILLALQEITGKSFGENPVKWNQWSVDFQGYALSESSTSPTPTFVENVPIGFAPSATPFITTEVVGLAPMHHSCFGAGTSVRTIEGAKPIEAIRRGDQVLVEDTITGALSYQPVLTAFHNPPAATLRVKVGDDEIAVTAIHRFWKAGHGWTMARNLKPGDSLRVLGGVATVEGIDHGQTQPVFNLEVAEARSFFVGLLGALVHDNSLVEATPNPFDGVPALTKAQLTPAR